MHLEKGGTPAAARKLCVQDGQIAPWLPLNFGATHRRRLELVGTTDDRSMWWVLPTDRTGSAGDGSHRCIAVLHDAGMAWFRRERTLNTVTGVADSAPRLTAEQRGNVTNAHRSVLGRFTPRPDAEWSTRAVWACLEELRHSTTTEAADVQVFDAWTDGPDAFCVVYSPPYHQPDERVGLRRERDDPEVPVSYGLSSTLFNSYGGDQVDDSGPADPIAFGVAVAAFDIGEPLGKYYDILRRDAAGLGWWGSLDGNTPLPSQ